MSSSFDVLVVGGGAIGACVALEAARRGLSTTLVERGAELAWGCSAGNAGLICPSHSAPLANPAALREGLRYLGKPDSPFYLRPRPGVLPWLARFVAACRPERAEAGSRLIRELTLASLALHAELAAAGLDTAFERRGTLNVYETEAGFESGRAEALRSGLGAQVLTPAEARALEPAIAAERLAGAVYFPGEAHCDPLRFVLAAGRAAAEAGAEIRTRVEVIGLRRENGRVVAATTAGELRARTVVLAAGAWTAQLAAQIGVFVPLEGGKGYHVDVELGEGDPRIPVFVQEGRTIATPMPGKLRLAGTLELAGLDLRVDRRRVEAIVRSIERAVPACAGRRVLEVWRGLRPCTPDGLPVIGSPAGLPGLVLATGHAMMGLSLAPVTGRLVGELLAGEAPSHDISALAPERFRPWAGR